MSEVGVLDKAVAILDAFPTGATILQPPAVAARLGIAPPTAYRLMKSMAEHGLLERDSGGYRLGVALLHLGARVADGLDLNHRARPHLEWLREQTSENAELHLLRGITRVPIQVVASSQNLRPMGQVGVPFPLHVGASAKVLLAWLPLEERKSLVLGSYGTAPSQSAFDMDSWERALAMTRKRGWAESSGEREAGVSSIAAPVRGHDGSIVAAIVVSGPSSRLNKRPTSADAVQAVLEAAERLSVAIGSDGDPSGRKTP